MANQKENHEELVKDLNIFSLLSTKGGVGKTTLAINMACELAPERTVVLLDCDIYNHGATLWLSDGIEEKDNILSISSAYHNFPSENTVIDDLIDSVKGFTPAKMMLLEPHNRKYFYFVPSLHLGENEKPIHGDNGPKSNPSVNQLQFEQHVGFLTKLFCVLHYRFQPDFIILDCHPGPVPLTLACTSLSRCNLIVSDYERATLQNSITFLWQVESEMRGKKCCKKHDWRFITNRVPSCDLLGNSTDRLRGLLTENEKNKSSLRTLFPSVENSALQETKEVLTEIPVLEEFQILENEQTAPLDRRRRGGNGFILAVRSMLRKMSLGGLLGGLRFDEDIKGYKEINEIYFPTRGVGKTGIDSKLFWLGVSGQISYLVYLFSLFLHWPRNIQFGLEVAILQLFVFSIFQILSMLRFSRRQFELFADVNPRLKQSLLNKLYHQGGTPGITTSVWWPRIAWMLSFCPGFALLIMRWKFETEYFQTLAELWKVWLTSGIIFITLSEFIVKKFSHSILRELWKDFKYFCSLVKAALTRGMYK